MRGPQSLPTLIERLWKDLKSQGKGWSQAVGAMRGGYRAWASGGITLWMAEKCVPPHRCLVLNH